MTYVSVTLPSPCLVCVPPRGIKVKFPCKALQIWVTNLNNVEMKNSRDAILGDVFFIQHSQTH